MKNEMKKVLLLTIVISKSYFWELKRIIFTNQKKRR